VATAAEAMVELAGAETAQGWAAAATVAVRLASSTGSTAHLSVAPPSPVYPEGLEMPAGWRSRI